ncbi:adenine deaminase [Pseudodesulfovibrio tunisiensis]|uniref:adenine deaminase n=1 Tax=Pseudodesulfovibrio tunisiensis TaxID=463192 RepID=UPI001FB44600|nr:adenine deaminase [Pseudodesulfovibrio tunisiensis]
MPLSRETLTRRIRLARGIEPADLLITGARVVNVISGEIHATDVAVADGVFLGFGNYEARRTLNAEGRYLCPGLIDGHIHIESSLLSPPRFARAVAARGTSAVVADPHEIANVLGADGVRYMADSSAGLPVAVYFMMPSCVPATHLEHSGATIGPDDIRALLAEYPDRILGLAEMMNFPGVLNCDPDVLDKLLASQGRPIDGHAPLVTGRDLAAYVMAGPHSDHESTTPEEALEKLRLGMHVMIREGTTEHNLEDLAPIVTSENSREMSLVSDDQLAPDLLDHGHMDHKVRLAVGRGIPPVRAIQMASLNTARHFGLDRGPVRHGAIAPGFRADFFLVDDLAEFRVADVHLGGHPLSPDQDFISGTTDPGNTMNMEPVEDTAFRIPAQGETMRVIGVEPGQLVTSHLTMPATIRNGLAEADPDRDIAKLAVLERHNDTGNIGLGFVQGLGLKRGAIASTVAHDSHNLIIAGASDADMLEAANRAMATGGGFCAVLDRKVISCLPLPIAGLMSNRPMEEVARDLDSLLRKIHAELGDFPFPNPFAMLSFLALPVIPELKLTDLGLVDGRTFEITSLWTDAK